MPVIPVIGPSHAGKTTLVRHLVNHASQYGFLTGLRLLDLDEELGEAHRTDVTKAREITEAWSKKTEFVLVDCGAGQIVFSPKFREFLTSTYPESFIVVWCNEQTFCKRHSQNELNNNYSDTLKDIWETARGANRLVDTSEGISCLSSVQKMAKIVKKIISANS